MQKEETTPLYKKLIEDLKKLMEEGKFKQGDLLPSENELCKSYNTTRPTVRQALAGLTNMGYITRHHGKGSIVAEPRRGLGILSVSGVTAGVGDLNLKTVILEKPVKRNWPPELMKDLNYAEQIAGCIYFTRVRIINNAPILYEETFLTDINLLRFTSRNLDNRSFLKILSEYYQVEVTGGEQKIWAVAADKSIARVLKISAGHPIVHMKRKLKTNVKNLNIYSWLYCNTENYYLDDRF
ncbi:MAG: GntR family transcriptional regulator [Chitinophagaceae bacterium]|nr:GntR family transcriptional regulator [Chitinophagaceae bacterium]